MGGVPGDTVQENGRVRLHITPFNPDLRDRILGASVLPLASHISYHTVQTYPERGFGYVELPEMEATKLKKKFNGSTLRGAKVRIEEAKPEKKRKSDASTAEDGTEKKKVKKSKTKQETDGVLSGYELPEGRKVKRGWTEGASKSQSGRVSKKVTRSAKESTVGGGKLLFKTEVPPNHAAVETKLKTKSKDKKGKEEKVRKKKVVVEEFGKRRKPPPDVNTVSAPAATSYEDGKGWVDEEGNVVEPERSRRRKKRDQREEDQPDSAVMLGVSRASSEVKGTKEIESADATISAKPEEAVQPTPSKDEDIEMATAETKVQADEASGDVHPLEALFKRPASKPAESGKPRPLPIDTSFSFFDSTANDDDDADIDDPDPIAPPQTPHTKQDMAWRSIRSAAPTPDTAAIGRHFHFPIPGGAEEDMAEENEDEDERMSSPTASAPAPTPAERSVGDGAATEDAGREEESAFRKWFYEHRGDLNRGWKKRRREEKKSLRQRENRRLGQKVA